MRETGAWNIDWSTIERANAVGRGQSLIANLQAFSHRQQEARAYVHRRVKQGIRLDISGGSVKSTAVFRSA